MRALNVLLTVLCYGALSVLAAEQQLHADSAQLDGKSGLMTYKGNARLFDETVSIDSDEMTTDYTEDGEIEFTRLLGSPARLEHIDPNSGIKTTAEAREIIYRASIGKIELKGDVKLQQEGKEAHTKVNADQLQLQQTSKRISAMDARGKPAIFERQQGNEAPYQGQAENISYRADGELLKLETAAKLTQGQSTIEHEVILHDGVNRRTTAPRREGSQVTITRKPTENKTP